MLDVLVQSNDFLRNSGAWNELKWRHLILSW